MAKIFRFSGYFVDDDINPYGSNEHFKERLTKTILDESSVRSIFQQLHVESSAEFWSGHLEGELDKNCDLALLTRHFKKNVPITFDRLLPKKGEKYKHFKTGKIVTVVGIARHTETEEISVIYEHEGKLWNRPIEMFMSEVDKAKYPDAAQRYRFEYCGEDMQKDIAATPIVESDGEYDGKPVYDVWKCPRCETAYEIDYEEYEYCPKCGQRININYLRYGEKELKQEGQQEKSQYEKMYIDRSRR